MSKNSDSNDTRVSTDALKNEYVQTLKDQIEMLQEHLRTSQSQHEAAQNRLMSMFEQQQRMLEDSTN